jgi:hypothetical protein
MTIIAPKSSMIAKAVRKIFSATGTLLPNSDSTPRANAISVAIGMPIPPCVAVPQLSKKWSRAGMAMPPRAAKMGRDAFFKSESSPT